MSSSPTDLLDHWLNLRQNVDDDMVVSASDLFPTRPAKRSRQRRKRDNDGLCRQLYEKKMEMRNELDTNFGIEYKNRQSSKKHRPAQVVSSSSARSSEDSNFQNARKPQVATDSIFYHDQTVQQSEVLRDRGIADIMGLLCMDNALRRVEMPNNEGTSLVPTQRYSESELLAELNADKNDESMDAGTILNMMLDPNHCLKAIMMFTSPPSIWHPILGMKLQPATQKT